MQYKSKKRWNESSAAGSVVTYESVTVSADRILVLDSSPGIILAYIQIVWEP